MYTKPSPQQVRDWMQKRSEDRQPLPTMEEIRRQLGWQLKQDRGTR
jgi:hypothetical protein